MSDFYKQIRGHDMEFFEREHLYLVDGIITPSITQILNVKFGGKYDGIPAEILDAASKKGVALHAAIEDYAKTGIIPERGEVPDEVFNFIWLQRRLKFDIVDSEVPVILFHGGEPCAAGRLDLVLRNKQGEIGGADIKRTATLDKTYLAYQLNLYRVAYAQSYGVTWEFLRGIHLRNTTRKIVDIPVNQKLVDEIIAMYQKGVSNG